MVKSVFQTLKCDSEHTVNTSLYSKSRVQKNYEISHLTLFPSEVGQNSFYNSVLNMWSQLFSHLQKSAHRCHSGILQVYWPILKGCTTDSMQSSSKAGLLTFLTTKAFLNRAIHNRPAPATPPPPPPIPHPTRKKQKKDMERTGLRFLYWPQWDSHQLLVSLSYAQQQLRSSAVIKPGTI